MLQYFPFPNDSTLVGRLNEVLERILTRTEVTKSVNKNNSDHSILFEAINLIIHQEYRSDEKLKEINQDISFASMMEELSEVAKVTKGNRYTCMTWIM